MIQGTFLSFYALSFLPFTLELRSILESGKKVEEGDWRGSEIRFAIDKFKHVSGMSNSFPSLLVRQIYCVF